jgi:large subunit ribosomal protein L23
MSEHITAEQERLMRLILGPRVSEKTTRLGEKYRQIVFKVISDATKPEIKNAVEILFNVKVQAVNVMQVKGKKRNFKQMQGQRKAWKKAYVALKEGYDIDFTGMKQ